MAIVRIYGGRDGIVDYLRNGKKIGRSLSRDQLDERVVLAGDLDLTDAILRSMDSPGQKFLHVTIAMKEDSLPIDVLKRITNDFEKFAFAAYSHDEYSLYAEAHLPRTKSLLNHDNGADIARLPHIHFVIPQINLVTGRRLDPFGLTERCIKYIDAWQEKTNHRYGLASPKDNFRTAFVDRSDIYLRANDRVPSAAQALKSKVLDAALAEEFWSPDSFVKFLNQFGPVNIHHAGQKNEYFSIKPASSRTRVRLTENVFSRSFLRLPAGQKENFVADTYGPNELAKADLKDRFLAGLDACKQSFSADPNGRRQLKDQILEEVLERDIRSTHAFRTMLSSFGEIRTRNAGRDNAYENVRPTGSIKGVNLKDFCFSEAFFQLSKADKIDHLERRESDRYLEAGAPRQPSEQLLATLDEWQRIGARERKFINSGNRRLWHTYQRASADEKVNLLDAREKSFNDRLRALVAGADRKLAGQRSQRADQASREDKSSPAKPKSGVLKTRSKQGQHDSVISQQVSDAATRSAIESTDIATIKRRLDGNALLNRLSISHGLIRKKYSVVRWKDGSDRIRSGNRHYPLNDFMTKEIRLPWQDAERILREEFALQEQGVGACPARQPPDSRLWKEFVRAHPPVHSSSRKAAQAEQRSREDAQKTDLEKQHRQKTLVVLTDPNGFTNASTFVMYDLHSAHARQKESIRRQVEQERENLRYALNQRSIRHYRAWLVSLAEKDMRALAELRFIATDRYPSNGSFLVIEGVLQAEEVLQLRQYDHRILDNGQVIYSRDGLDRIVDTDTAIHVLHADDFDIESALRLALMKFGNRLKLSGNDDFLLLAAEVAARANLPVEFHPPWLNNVMASCRQDPSIPEDPQLAQESETGGEEVAPSHRPT